MFDLGHARNKCIFCVRLFPDTKSEDASVYAACRDISDLISNSFCYYMSVRRPESSWANADDHLPLDALCRIEGGNGVIEGGFAADVRLQSSVPQPLDDLAELGAIGLNNKVDR